MNSKLTHLTKVFMIITSIILVVMFFVILGLDRQNKELNRTNQELNVSINKQKNSINELLQNNEELNAENTQLIGSINKLQNENKILKEHNQKVLNQIENLESQIKTFKEYITELEDNLIEDGEIIITTANAKDFKSYLPYDAITNTISRQWELQQQATTNEDGIRCIDGIPLVAVGTGWGLKVGDTALVICENGNSFKVMIGDIKADIHTDEENKTTVFSNCRCEFIVELDKLDPKVKSMGNVAILSKYSGYVVNIERIN